MTKSSLVKRPSPFQSPSDQPADFARLVLACLEYRDEVSACEFAVQVSIAKRSVL